MTVRVWGRRTAVITALSVALTVAGGGAALATPPAGGVPGGDDMTIDNTKWPTALDKFLPGSPAFEATYGTGMTDPIGGQCATDGGDLWAYTRDFITNIGTILDAVATATGQAPLQMDGRAIPTAPWDATAFTSTDLVVQVADDGGTPVYASPGNLLPFDDTPNPNGPCLDDFARFADPDGASVLGFGFYPTPDQGSIDYLRDAVAHQQPATTTTVSGGEVGPMSQYWDPTSANALRRWSYSPLDVTQYCRDGNPFCVTASFLHCPGDSSDSATQQAVVNCRIFNSNVMILNQRLALWLGRPGVGERSDGKPERLVDVITDPGSQAPLDLWLVWASDANTITGIAHTMELVLAGGLLAGAFLAGGLLGVLVAAGVVALASGAFAAAWGAITCGTDLGKCLAKAGADALSASMGLIRTAVTTDPPVDLSPYAPFLDNLAGVAGILLIALFFLTLALAVWTGRFGKILPAGVGLIEWAMMVGLGATILTALGALSDTLADAISTTGTSSDAITSLAKGMATAAVDLPDTTTGGWLLAFFAAVIGALAGAVIWLILTMAPAFIPLTVALMLLQSSGLATGGWGRRWIGRGFSLLWTILLLRPAIALVSRVADIGMLDEGLRGLIVGCLLLCIAAIAPIWVGRMFPLTNTEASHLGAAVFTAMSVTRSVRMYPSPLRSLPSRAGLLGRVTQPPNTPPPAAPGGATGPQGGPPTPPPGTGGSPTSPQGSGRTAPQGGPGGASPRAPRPTSNPGGAATARTPGSPESSSSTGTSTSSPTRTASASSPGASPSAGPSLPRPAEPRPGPVGDQRVSARDRQLGAPGSDRAKAPGPSSARPAERHPDAAAMSSRPPTAAESATPSSAAQVDPPDPKARTSGRSSVAVAASASTVASAAQPMRPKASQPDDSHRVPPGSPASAAASASTPAGTGPAAGQNVRPAAPSAGPDLPREAT